MDREVKTLVLKEKNIQAAHDYGINAVDQTPATVKGNSP